MENQLYISGLTLLSVVVGILIGAALTILWHNSRSRRFRVEHDIPNIIGRWRCQWFDDALESGEPKIEDTVEIQKWTTNGEFLGLGHQPQFHLSYPVVGEIDPSRVVILTYKAGRYPYEPNRGVALMQVSREGKTMEGRWFGRRYNGELSGGRVKCFRSSDAAA